MFDDEDVAYDEVIAFVFGDGTPPSIGDDLRAMGATVASGSCSECDGTLYNCDHEVVCANCSLVIGSDTDHDTQSLWERFRDDRPGYHNSNHKRCPGGFPDSYDWVKREDIDQPVKKVNPDTFYK